MTEILHAISNALASVKDVIWGPLLLPLLVGGGLFLTVRSGCAQFRRFGYAMKHTVGKLFEKKEAGHGAVTPLQALTTALAATVGTGNIVGTAQAIAMGGYGAVFWLWIAALLGMIIKYAEVVLAIQYRERNSKGDWVGGPMYYITKGLGKNWKWLAGLFCVLAALASFGIGNMSQANSIVDSVTDAVTALAPNFANVTALKWVLGIALAILTALVLFGGIKRIGAVTEKLIPFMSLTYILFTLVVIFGNISHVGECFSMIITAAFAPRAVMGAATGIALKQAVVWGLRRSAFSNEAGLGSAPIAHAAAETDSAVEHGMFGVFEVFMDTLVICTLTALTIIISDVEITYGVKPGSELITAAFSTVWGGKLSALFVAIALVCFAYSTILGWSLYGTRCVEYLLGHGAARVYQLIFIVVIVVGSVSSLDFVWNLADTFNGLMAIPNFIALFALSPVVFKLTKDHFRKRDTLKK